MEFHNQIYRETGRRRLIRIWDSLRVPLLHTFRLHRQFFDSADLVHQQHRELLDQIRSGDPERAGVAAAEHIMGWRGPLLEHLASLDAEGPPGAVGNDA